MKKLFLIPLALTLSFCCSKKPAVDSSKITSIESICPDDGTCTIQIIKNKSLMVKTDDLGGIYYHMEDNSNTSIIKYEYNRTVEEGLQDGQHREEIVFEINNNATELKLRDADLQTTKMLFGRHCFCKGQAGFFRIEEGTLNLSNKNEVISFDLDFKTHSVPQLFEKVKASVK